MTVLVALLLGPLGFTAAAQTNVAGTIVSGTGEPLAGVQVSIPNLQMGTLTNTDGRYVIQNVPNGAQDHASRAHRVREPAASSGR